MKTLWLVPTPLAPTPEGDTPLPAWMTGETRQRVHSMRCWLVETEKTARQWIKAFEYEGAINELHIVPMESLTEASALFKLFERFDDIGVMSDAGCPGVADPGARMVQWAHELGMSVQPLVGPSALLLGLMGSGLNGQKFAFHGYLPSDKPSLSHVLKHLDQLSSHLNQTQMAIETPYRNAGFMDAALDSLRPDTLLCVAQNLTGSSGFLKTASVIEWRRHSDWVESVGQKAPTLYLWLAKPSPAGNAQKKPRQGAAQGKPPVAPGPVNAGKRPAPTGTSRFSRKPRQK